MYTKALFGHDGKGCSVRSHSTEIASVEFSSCATQYEHACEASTASADRDHLEYFDRDAGAASDAADYKRRCYYASQSALVRSAVNASVGRHSK